MVNIHQEGTKDDVEETVTYLKYTIATPVNTIIITVRTAKLAAIPAVATLPSSRAENRKQVKK